MVPIDLLILAFGLLIRLCTGSMDLQLLESSLNGSIKVGDASLDSPLHQPWVQRPFRATFLVLCRNSELYDILETLQSVEDRFNRHYHYDYVFLNDKAFSSLFVDTVRNFLSLSQVSFGQIPENHWSYPTWIDQEKAAKVRDAMEKADIIYGGSESYRHMCRYYSGFFYQHELLQDYDYYWRIEPGIKLLCDVTYDVFELMYKTQKKFAFTLTMFEYSHTIPTLWLHVKQYMQENSISGDLLPLTQNDDPAKSYNLCHFWSNFEIASLDIFRNQNYSNFFNYLDHTGGFFYERWGDAPIHTLYISLYLRKQDLLYLEDFGYFHSPYSQCPLNQKLRNGRRCICDPDIDFTHSFQSCTPHFLRVLND